MSASEVLIEPERRLEVKGHYDVVVVGGGPAGISAAVAAARRGARTVLVERASFLGGTATGAMVASFMGFFLGDERVTGGIPYEILGRLEAIGGGSGFLDYVMGEASDSPLPVHTYPFDSELLKVVLDELVTEAGVELRLHAQGVDAVVENGRVTGVVVQGRTERYALRGTVVIDASADGVIAKGAGAELENARQDPRLRQPMTQVARFVDVDMPAFRALPIPEKQRLAATGMELGVFSQRLMSVVSSPHGNDAVVLMTRVSGRDGTDDAQLSLAEVEGRQRILRVAGFLREHVPGFERSRLQTIASWIGIRETWRIIGDYVVTQEDIVTGRAFDDQISLGCGPLDIHHPSGGGLTLIVPERPFGVPYRSLLPAGVDGLLMAGRCISATHEGMAALRHMGTVMTTGEAAGAAAAQAVSRGVTPREVDVQALRETLREAGAIVDQADVVPGVTTPPAVSRSVEQ